MTDDFINHTVEVCIEENYLITMRLDDNMRLVRVCYLPDKYIEIIRTGNKFDPKAIIKASIDLIPYAQVFCLSRQTREEWEAEFDQNWEIQKYLGDEIGDAVYTYLGCHYRSILKDMEFLEGCHSDKDYQDKLGL